MNISCIKRYRAHAVSQASDAKTDNAREYWTATEHHYNCELNRMQAQESL